MLLCLVAVWTIAAGGSLYAQFAWASGSSRGIELLWLPPEDMPMPTRYTLRRALSESGRWIDIAVTTPQPSPDSVFRKLFLRARSSDTAANRAALRQLYRLFVLNPRAIAATLGTYFHDTTTTPLAQYDYQIWSGSTLVATVVGVESHQRKLPTVPSSIRWRQRAQCIELWWSLDSAFEQGIVAYALYRATGSQSPLRLTKRPLWAHLLSADTNVSGFVRDCLPPAPATATYYVAAVDVFGTEGQPATTTVAPSLAMLPLPTPVSVADGLCTLAFPFHGIPATGHDIALYIRTTLADQWHRPAYTIRDTALVVEPFETAADGFSLTLSVATGFQRSWQSIPYFLPVCDTTPPTRPTYCEVYRDGRKVVLRWTHIPAEDNAGYILERATAQDTTVHFVSDTMTVITDAITEGMRYRIRAIDTHGNVSQATPWIQVSVPHSHRPLLRTVEPINEGVRLEWSVPPATAQVLVNRYDDTAAAPITLAILPGTATSFVDRGRISPQCHYEIVTIDSNGLYSLPSQRHGIRSALPCAVHLIDSAVYRNRTVVLYWHASSHGDILIERSEEGSDELLVLARVHSSKGRFDDSTTIPGKTYIYRLRCVGVSANAQDASVTITIPP
ncbi:MAG: hypothetical protein RMK00_04240 [Bacteroidota bacterium]|nr:hypothetical protein [Bacteroidota bacterium]